MGYKLAAVFSFVASVAFFGIACADNGTAGPLFIDKGLAVGLGTLTLLITAAITIGKRTAVFDAHMKDPQIHAERSELQDKFVDKGDFKETVKLVQKTHETVVEIDSKVNRLIEKGKE